MANRREFLGGVSAMGGLALLGGNEAFGDEGTAPTKDAPLEYKLPPLPYDYDALEPHIDAKTMRIHHDKHHAGYTRGLNKVISKLSASRDSGDFGKIQQLSRLLAFHAGRYFNHIIFWNNMAKAGYGGGGRPTGTLATQIKNDFGAFNKFQAHFNAATKAIEGNGWGVLAYHPALQRLVVMTMMNQQDLVTIGSVPLLMCDVWEHAYYISYQNRRGDYIKAWWNVVNWDNVAKRFAAVP